MQSLVVCSALLIASALAGDDLSKMAADMPAPAGLNPSIGNQMPPTPDFGSQQDPNSLGQQFPAGGFNQAPMNPSQPSQGPMGSAQQDPSLQFPTQGNFNPQGPTLSFGGYPSQGPQAPQGPSQYGPQIGSYGNFGSYGNQGYGSNSYNRGYGGNSYGMRGYRGSSYGPRNSYGK